MTSLKNSPLLEIHQIFSGHSKLTDEEVVKKYPKVFVKDFLGIGYMLRETVVADTDTVFDCVSSHDFKKLVRHLLNTFHSILSQGMLINCSSATAITSDAINTDITHMVTELDL